jgi:hypothetical protein
MKEIEIETTNTAVKNGRAIKLSFAAADVNGRIRDAVNFTEKLIQAREDDPKCGPGEKYNPQTQRCEPE